MAFLFARSASLRSSASMNLPMSAIFRETAMKALARLSGSATESAAALSCAGLSKSEASISAFTSYPLSYSSLTPVSMVSRKLSSSSSVPGSGVEFPPSAMPPVKSASALPR